MVSNVSSVTPQLLTSASIYVHDSGHNLIRCRVLLDTGATTNFITESMIKRLRIPVHTLTTEINVMGNLSTTSCGTALIMIQARHNEFHKELTCIVVPIISERIPAEPFPRESITLPPNIVLADPNFHVSRAIDILIGCDISNALHRTNRFNTGRLRSIYAKD